MSTQPQQRKRRQKYEPKWKKKRTLAEEMQDDESHEQQQQQPPSFDRIGIKGDISVVFRQGNVTRTSLAFRGQPLRDVATQAGQLIKYGCGKGECGTCEALCDGKWIRPCTAVVPPDAMPGLDFVVVVKDMKSKKVSSGKFFSVRSFLLGFWNNFLGMVGMVTSRRAAKRSWNERQEYEDFIKRKTLEKKRARQQQPQNVNPNLKP